MKSSKLLLEDGIDGLFVGIASEENTGLCAVVGVEADVGGPAVEAAAKEESWGRRLLTSPPVGDFFRPMMDAAEVGCKVCAMIGYRRRERYEWLPYHRHNPSHSFTCKACYIKCCYFNIKAAYKRGEWQPRKLSTWKFSK